MNKDSELEGWARQWRAEIGEASGEARISRWHSRLIAVRLALRFAIVILACLATAWEIRAEHSVPAATEWLLVAASLVLSWVQEQATGASAGQPGKEYAVILVRSGWVLLSISSLGMVASLCAAYSCVSGLWFGTGLRFVVRSSMLIFAIGCFVLSVKRARDNVRLLHGMRMLQLPASGELGADSILAHDVTTSQSRFIGRRKKYKKRRGAM